MVEIFLDEQDIGMGTELARKEDRVSSAAPDDFGPKVGTKMFFMVNSRTLPVPSTAPLPH